MCLYSSPVKTFRCYIVCVETGECPWGWEQGASVSRLCWFGFMEVKSSRGHQRCARETCGPLLSQSHTNRLVVAFPSGDALLLRDSHCGGRFLGRDAVCHRVVSASDD